MHKLSQFLICKNRPMVQRQEPAETRPRSNFPFVTKTPHEYIRVTYEYIGVNSKKKSKLKVGLEAGTVGIQGKGTPTQRKRKREKKGKKRKGKKKERRTRTRNGIKEGKKRRCTLVDNMHTLSRYVKRQRSCEFFDQAISWPAMKECYFLTPIFHHFHAMKR